MSARITASPSDDMEIRRALRPLGGDGVISSSLRTRASPSKESEIRSEGGDLTLVSCTSDVDRLRLDVSGVDTVGAAAAVVAVAAGCPVVLWSSTSVAICELEGASSVAVWELKGSSVTICELDASASASASTSTSAEISSSRVSGASSLLGSKATRGARSSWGWRGFDFRRSFWRRFWNHIYFFYISPCLSVQVS